MYDSSISIITSETILAGMLKWLHMRKNSPISQLFVLFLQRTACNNIAFWLVPTVQLIQSSCFILFYLTLCTPGILPFFHPDSSNKFLPGFSHHLRNEGRLLFLFRYSIHILPYLFTSLSFFKIRTGCWTRIYIFLLDFAVTFMVKPAFTTCINHNSNSFLIFRWIFPFSHIFCSSLFISLLKMRFFLNNPDNNKMPIPSVSEYIYFKRACGSDSENHHFLKGRDKLQCYLYHRLHCTFL